LRRPLSRVKVAAIRPAGRLPWAMLGATNVKSNASATIARLTITPRFLQFTADHHGTGTWPKWRRAAGRAMADFPRDG